MLQLDDPNLWSLALSENWTAAPGPKPEEWVPIPETSVSLSSTTLLIGTGSVSAPAWAWLGCRISARFNADTGASNFLSPVEVARRRVPLRRRSLIQLPDVQPRPYTLVVSVPFWLRDLSIEIWEYVG